MGSASIEDNITSNRKDPLPFKNDTSNKNEMEQRRKEMAARDEATKDAEQKAEALKTAARDEAASKTRQIERLIDENAELERIKNLALAERDALTQLRLGLEAERKELMLKAGKMEELYESSKSEVQAKTASMSTLDDKVAKLEAKAAQEYALKLPDENCLPARFHGRSVRILNWRSQTALDFGRGSDDPNINFCVGHSNLYWNSNQQLVLEKTNPEDPKSSWTIRRVSERRYLTDSNLYFALVQHAYRGNESDAQEWLIGRSDGMPIGTYCIQNKRSKLNLSLGGIVQLWASTRDQIMCHFMAPDQEDVRQVWVICPQQIFESRT